MKRLLLFFLGLLLTSCEAQATPIAAIVTATASPEPSAIPIPELRYGISANLAPYLGNMDDIPFETIGADNLTEFDLVVAYGIYDGWQQAPQSHRVSLAINPNLSPLDNQTIRDLIPRLINSQLIIDNLNIPGAQQTTALSPDSAPTIRTRLANTGFPDGFQLTMATENIPTIDMLLSQFANFSLDIRLIELSDTVLIDNQAHFVLFMWANDSERTQWLEQVGEENIIDLWTIPISYLNNGNVPVEFTENGIPIPAP